MSERAAHIRGFTLRRLEKLPTPPVSMSRLARYSVIAARWEGMRLRLARSVPTPAEDERFSTLTGVLRSLSAGLGLSTCTADNANADGIPGVTDRNGWLPGDPARIVYPSWSDEHTALPL